MIRIDTIILSPATPPNDKLRRVQFIAYTPGVRFSTFTITRPTRVALDFVLALNIRGLSRNRNRTIKIHVHGA